VKKILATLGAALMMMGLFGVAAEAAPGPNGNNNKGLCTAYFNGSEQGRANKRNAPPFVALQEAAEEKAAQEGGTGSTGEQAVREFCAGMIGGNPDVRDSEPGSGKSKRPS